MESEFSDNSTDENDIIIKFGPAGTINIITENPIAIVFCMLIATFGFVGNASVVYIVIKIKMPKMQTMTNKFIANLAVTDTAVSVYFVVRGFYHLVINKNTSYILCKAGTYILNVFGLSSIFTLAAISIERCIAIKYPLKIISSMYYVTATALMWLFSAMENVPILLASKLLPDGPGSNHSQCVEHWTSSEWHDIFGTFDFVACFITPFTVITMSYVLIWVEVRRHRMMSGKHSANRDAQNIRLAKMIFVIIVAYIVVLLPFFGLYSVASMSPEFRKESETNKTIYYMELMASCLLVVHFSLNPIIYCFMNKNFRNGFKKIFFRRI